MHTLYFQMSVKAVITDYIKNNQGTEKQGIFCKRMLLRILSNIRLYLLHQGPGKKMSPISEYQGKNPAQLIFYIQNICTSELMISSPGLQTA